jgi:hypothetical protein
VRSLPEGGFRVPDAPSVADLGVAHGTQLKPMLLASLDALGGIGRFIQRGDVVVIKPNVAFERPAALGATTNPELLTALIEIVREAGAKEIRVADNPIESPSSCFVRSCSCPRRRSLHSWGRPVRPGSSAGPSSGGRSWAPTR